MKRSITAPLFVKSENKYRGFYGGFVAASSSAKTRKDVAMVLTQLPKPIALLADGTPNRYVVTLTRIFMGRLDDDNLRGAFKAVRDEIAAWIGIDDGDARISWEYGQLGCKRGLFAIRIDIQDLEPGNDYARELSGVPNVILELKQRGAEKPVRPQPPKVRQVELVFREAFAVLPWEQDEGDPVLSPLSMRGADPPKLVRMRVPAKVLSSAASVRFAPGQEVVLERGLGRVEGVEVWLYSPREERQRQEPMKGSGR